MKKTFTLLIGIVLSVMILNAQEEAPPQALSYKAIIRKSNGQLLINKTVNFRISILKGSKDGNTVYSETFQPTTNEFGQIDIEIGRGTPEPGPWPEIKLGDDEYFLKTEVDVEGGTNFQLLSVTQLLSVPYALYAGEAKNGFVSEYTEGDPRPVLHEDGNVSLGPTITPYWDTWFRLNVNGPLNITTGDKSWGADVILNAMNKGGNMFAVSSVGSMAPCPGSFWITTVDPVGKLNYNGSIVMKYNGNVGINTLNPTSKLDVNGTVIIEPGGQDYGALLALNSKPAAGGKMYIIGSTAGPASEGQGKFLIRTEDWSSIFLMDSDGNIGIDLGKEGTPKYKLDVAGDINFTGGLFKEGQPFSGDYANLTNKPDLSVYATNVYVNVLESRITELENLLKNNGLILKDADGNTYNAVTIGSQTWMKENLKTTKYNNGDPIPNITVASEWIKLTTGAYCWYNNDAVTYENPYGKLYNSYAMTDDRKICPTGWHVPKLSEWFTLFNFLGGTEVAGGKLKEAGTIHWLSPNTGATNESGFTALPGGRRLPDGSFTLINFLGTHWSSTSANSKLYNVVDLFAEQQIVIVPAFQKVYGASVRCIRDF
jgi:uncharacterized protein (TIGR02145 family)